MARTFHSQREERHSGRVTRVQMLRAAETLAETLDGIAERRAVQHRLSEMAHHRNVAVRAGLGEHAGEMARVGLDARGRFVIVPVSQIVGRTDGRGEES